MGLLWMSACGLRDAYSCLFVVFGWTVVGLLRKLGGPPVGGVFSFCRTYNVYGMHVGCCASCALVLCLLYERFMLDVCGMYVGLSFCFAAIFPLVFCTTYNVVCLRTCCLAYAGF